MTLFIIYVLVIPSACCQIRILNEVDVTMLKSGLEGEGEREKTNQFTIVLFSNKCVRGG